MHSTSHTLMITLIHSLHAHQQDQVYDKYAWPKCPEIPSYQDLFYFTLTTASKSYHCPNHFPDLLQESLQCLCRECGDTLCPLLALDSHNLV